MDDADPISSLISATSHLKARMVANLQRSTAKQSMSSSTNQSNVRLSSSTMALASLAAVGAVETPESVHSTAVPRFSSSAASLGVRSSAPTVPLHTSGSTAWLRGEVSATPAAFKPLRSSSSSTALLNRDASAVSRALATRIDAPRARLETCVRTLDRRTAALVESEQRMIAAKAHVEARVCTVLKQHLDAAVEQMHAHAAHVAALRLRAATQLDACSRIDARIGALGSHQATADDSHTDLPATVTDHMHTLEVIEREGYRLSEACHTLEPALPAARSRFPCGDLDSDDARAAAAASWLPLAEWLDERDAVKGSLPM